MDDMVRSQMDTGQALLILDVLLKALGTKVLMLLSLVMSFGLFCWAMWLQTLLGVIVAGAFGLGALWPVLYIGMQRSSDT
jgi:hypothetical protein